MKPFAAGYRHYSQAHKLHALRNGRIAAGYRMPNMNWRPGEQERMIAEAIERGKVTKCKPGYTLDQGTLGIEEIKL